MVEGEGLHGVGCESLYIFIVHHVCSSVVRSYMVRCEALDSMILLKLIRLSCSIFDPYLNEIHVSNIDSLNSLQNKSCVDRESNPELGQSMVGRPNVNRYTINACIILMTI
jgi:hypothetical protein